MLLLRTHLGESRSSWTAPRILSAGEKRDERIGLRKKISKEKRKNGKAWNQEANYFQKKLERIHATRLAPRGSWNPACQIAIHIKSWLRKRLLLRSSHTPATQATPNLSTRHRCQQKMIKRIIRNCQWAFLLGKIFHRSRTHNRLRAVTNYHLKIQGARKGFASFLRTAIVPKGNGANFHTNQFQNLQGKV